MEAETVVVERSAGIPVLDHATAVALADVFAALDWHDAQAAVEDAPGEEPPAIVFGEPVGSRPDPPPRPGRPSPGGGRARAAARRGRAGGPR